MGDDSALDEALRISALAYLDKLDPPEQNEQKAEQKPEKTGAEAGKDFRAEEKKTT